jgi:uncharacterized protein (DUF1499 family)
VDFKTLKLKSSPNQYLVCPDGTCANATQHRTSPEYAMPAPELARTLLDIALAEPRTELAEGSADDLAFRLVQKSALFRFADDIDVQVIPLGEDRSTVAIYSRSRVGYSDLGVNRKRVERWLATIAA